MKNNLSVVMGSALTLVTCTGVMRAGEKRVSYGDLPPAVKETSQRESQGAMVKGYSKEVEHGRTAYEVEMIADGKSRDILIDSSGKVVEIEQQVSLDAVPEAATASIQKRAGGGSILKVEEVKSDSETVYEAQILSNGKHRELRVHADGSATPEQD
jgi:uncharacterized membrane protein YkoI